MKPADTPDGSALCIGCGMCCNGTLFSRAKVTTEEQISLGKLGFSFSEFEGEIVFEQPCHKESCGSCTIYAARPAVCQEYRCDLLRRYQSGAITLEEARSKQDLARQLIAAVVNDNKDAAQYGARRDLRARLETQMRDGDVNARRAVARQYLNVMALDSYLERWFRKKRPSDSGTQTPE